MNDVTLMFVVRGLQGRVLGWVTSRTWWYVRNKGVRAFHRLPVLEVKGLARDGRKIRSRK